MIAITYTLYLNEPLLIAGIEGDPNTKRSLDYVPGSTMRGAIIGQYLQQRSNSNSNNTSASGSPMLDAKDAKERRLFLSNHTRYLNAYPAVPLSEDKSAKRQRLLPTPRSLHKEKKRDLEDERVVFDRIFENDRDLQTSSVGAPFCWLDDVEDYVYLHTPLRRIQVHSRRNRRMGRATADDGAVFQYEALAAEQEFSGIILIDETESSDVQGKDAQLLLDLLDNQTLWLGGSRDAGYGCVAVSAAVVDEWSGEIGAAVQGIKEGGSLCLTSLSPWVLHDLGGHAATMLEPEQIERYLGVEGLRLALSEVGTQRTTTMIGGFNRTWELPLPQTQAIAQGSTFTYTVMAGEIPAETLTKLQERGIGAQRIDGFGRVAVNWQQEAELAYQNLPKKKSVFDDAPKIVAEAHRTLVQQMGERVLRAELDRALAARVQKLRLKNRSEISNSLLSRLRTRVRASLFQLQQQTPEQLAQRELAALIDSELKPISELIDNLRPFAKEQLRRARLRTQAQDGKRLGTWINERLSGVDSVWQDEITEPEPIQFGTESVAVPPAWQIEYTLRLIDGVLAQAAKEPKKERGGNTKNRRAA